MHIHKYIYIHIYIQAPISNHITAVTMFENSQAAFLSSPPPQGCPTRDWLASVARAQVSASTCTTDIVICNASMCAKSHQQWMHLAAQTQTQSQTQTQTQTQTQRVLVSDSLSGDDDGVPTTAEGACKRLCRFVS
jgi:hypothetical protein